MPEARTLSRLHDMLSYASEARDLVQGCTRADLDANRLLNLALVRLLEVVGEAASQAPSEDRRLYPSIPWSPIMRCRNRIIHGYFSVDLDIVWEVANKDLPPLIAELERVVSREEPS